MKATSSPQVWGLAAAGAAAGLVLVHTFRRWDHALLTACVAGMLFSLLAGAMTQPWYAQRFVGRARPGQLGALRMWVAGILLANILWEDFASTALLPRGMMRPHLMGAFQALYALPGFDRFLVNEPALRLFEGITTLLLACATVGLATRFVVPLAAIGYLVLGAINRQYCWFYHTGLIPAYVLAVLSATPCADGWSVDRWLRRARGRPVPPADEATFRYGWARYAGWVVIALPYVAAGLSKLRNGGWGWWHPVNIKSIILRDSLNPMAFDWGVSLHLLHAPDLLFALIGIGTIVGEIGFLAVLFSRWARIVFPALMLSMHLGIWALQDVLFFDLIFLLLIFFDPTEARRLFSRATDGRAGGERGRGGLGPPLAVAALATLLITAWVRKAEFYPFTSMQMYSQTTTSGELKDKFYYKVFATRASGRVTPAPLEEAIRAMADGRYRRVLGQCFQPAHAAVCEQYLQAAGAAYNRRAPAADAIIRFDVQQWTWNFLTDPTSPTHGTLVADRTVAVGSSP